MGLALLVLATSVYAEHPDKDKLCPYRQLTTITIPEGLTGFDINWVDSESGRYYLTNRGNATATPQLARVFLFSTPKRDKFVYAIPLSTAGNGVVAIRRSGDDDEGDGSGTLVVGGTDSTTSLSTWLAPLHHQSLSVPVETIAPTNSPMTPCITSF